MNPFEQALAVYSREPCARTFSEDLEAHLRHGLVISTPEYFLMARKVIVASLESDIINPHVQFDPLLSNCWHLYLFAGDVAKAFAAADVQLPWVSFERRNKLRLYPWHVIFKKSARIFKS